jgi:hypothetical protein
MNYRIPLAMAIAAISAPALAATAQQEAFGSLPDGRQVEAVVLSNENGMRVRILAWLEENQG